MEMQPQNSQPIGIQHYAKLVERVQDLEKKISALENTTPTAIQMKEISAAPANGPADSARLYVVDNGAGKTSLRVIFSSGAAQTIATQP